MEGLNPQVNHVRGPMELSADEAAHMHLATKLNGHLGPSSNMAVFNKDAKALHLSNKLTEHIRSVIIKRC
jgi:hypothetical protein